MITSNADIHAAISKGILNRRYSPRATPKSSARSVKMAKVSHANQKDTIRRLDLSFSRRRSASD